MPLKCWNLSPTCSATSLNTVWAAKENKTANAINLPAIIAEVFSHRFKRMNTDLAKIDTNDKAILLSGP
jgi:hypothetical protein